MSISAPKQPLPFGCEPDEVVHYVGHAPMTLRTAVMLLEMLPSNERNFAVIFRNPSKQPAILTIYEINELRRNERFMGS